MGCLLLLVSIISTWKKSTKKKEKGTEINAVTVHAAELTNLSLPVILHFVFLLRATGQRIDVEEHSLFYCFYHTVVTVPNISQRTDWKGSSSNASVAVFRFSSRLWERGGVETNRWPCAVHTSNSVKETDIGWVVHRQWMVWVWSCGRPTKTMTLLKGAIHVIIHLSSNLLDVWVCVKEMGTSPKAS